MWARLIFVVVGLIASLARAAEPGPVLVDDAFSSAKLGKYLEVAYDPGGRASFDEVREGALRFENVTIDAPSFGYRKGAEWARFRVDDRRSAGASLFLTQTYAQTDRIDVFWFEGERLVQKTLGDHVPPPPERERVLARAPTVRIPPGSRTVYVRLETNSSHQLPLTLQVQDAFEASRWRDLSVQALYFGAVFMIALYNLVLWLAMRWRAYGFYVGFLVSMVSFIGALNGFAYVLAPHAPGWLHDIGVPLGGIIAAPTATEFLIALIGRESFSPRLLRLLRAAAWVSVSSCALGWAVDGYAGSMQVLTVSAPLNIVFLLAANIPVARRGNRAARLFLWSWGVFLFGSVCNALRMRGVIPTNAITANTQQVGAALEALLLSIALADRTKALEREARRNAELARSATERALEEQERTNRELTRLDKLKDEFLANTSHELRTPLHGIVGLTEAVLANAASLEASARDRLALVLASAHRLTALVNDILDFSKLRHQELALRLKSIELEQAIKLALAVAHPIVGSKDLRLRAEVPLGVRVRVDENRLQQILTNLVGNAIKFTERGEVTVRARVDESRAIVSVHDTGIGIAPEALSRVFESFEQADGSTARRFGGTGLGLAVTRKLVELHGGSLSVVSELGVGSAFTFDIELASAVHETEELAPRVVDALPSVLTLPSSVRFVDDPSDLPPIPHGPSPGAERATPRGHLLVADDDPVNLEVLRAQLEPAGYRVTLARDGREALDALTRDSSFDGVLLDVMMPRVTGPEAAEQMRVRHPHGTLPILMLTAKSRPEDVVVGLRAGASDYLGKPFHREELLQRLDSHVQAVRNARAFRRFVPEDFLRLLGASRFDELRAGVGQRHELTVLFADIRRFTSRSEELGPEGTFAFVNGCLRRFAPVIRAHGGFVDKFIGDAVMAIFANDAAQALAAASKLQEEVLLFNREHGGGAEPLAIGVGVHRGPVILGTVGHDERLEVTAIGDAVNVAARLEAMSKQLAVGGLVSGDVAECDPAAVRPIGFVQLRGRRETIELFEVLRCCASDAEREQKSLTRASFADALAAWRAGRMPEALAGFRAIAELCPLDGVAALYAARAERHVREGLPAGFEGDLGAA